jgi:gamma-glutamyltranspeptidase
MSGILIKGTIQVQDSESISAQATAILAKNPNYIQQYLTVWVSGVDEAGLAVSITNDLNNKLGSLPEYALVSITTNIQGTNHSAFITYVQIKGSWV